MTAGDARAEYDQMLRDKAARARHDPGEPGQHLDQAVSRVVYDLRDAGVRDQAEAMRAIADREGAGLNPGQIATVLWQFPPPPGPEGLRPVGPYYVPPDQRVEDD